MEAKNKIIVSQPINHSLFPMVAAALKSFWTSWGSQQEELESIPSGILGETTGIKNSPGGQKQQALTLFFNFHTVYRLLKALTRKLLVHKSCLSVDALLKNHSSKQ